MKEMNTLVLGASENRSRYSNIAIRLLKENGYNVLAIGARKGKVMDVEIKTIAENFLNVDTITLYLNPENQKKYYQYMLSLKPRRIIFNPGTENPELNLMAVSKGIQTENACTLVLLNLHQY
ncbi:MAG: CoA-binding protein [Saprospiraceae bacterium]|nr:CoA-binding protein [Saprospiraceae bacterium]